MKYRVYAYWGFLVFVGTMKQCQQFINDRPSSKYTIE